MSKEVVRYLVKVGRDLKEMVFASDYEALLAERDALAERLAEARFSLDGMAELCRDARDERDALTKDADRYRWLRDAEELPFNLMKTEMMGATLDAAIDAALQGEQP
ncbi:glycine--tRNA ligase [Pseudomonas sp. MT-1]|uniref:hypothetical protein n=1 Tax=Stutzerimonas stutzeri TaxID=316 RepID=UPI0005363DB4|nr:hypothetical protein [Stutzerimonas stutzeri]MCQ4282590.1 hypothetical protein [Stutzerimonas stutzeri]BAP80941.1 glycine--tRNA ligase [Pseudomonas sp. MT-1]